MTPNATHAPSQSTQAVYLIAISSNSEKRPTSYLIKCPTMRYCSLTWGTSQLYPGWLQLLHGVAASQSMLSLLFRSMQSFPPKWKKMLSLLRKVCKFPFFKSRLNRKSFPFPPKEGSFSTQGSALTPWAESMQVFHLETDCVFNWSIYHTR